MDCTHHWVIEEPKGTKKVAGECKKCGISKNFNSSYNEDKFNTVPLRRRKANGDTEISPLNEVVF